MPDGLWPAISYRSSGKQRFAERSNRGGERHRIVERFDVFRESENEKEKKKKILKDIARKMTNSHITETRVFRPNLVYPQTHAYIHTYASA